MDELSTFHGGGSRESPARSTLSLVLDSVNSSLSSPIEGCTEFWNFFKNGWLINGLWALVSEKFLVFFMSPGGHEVVTNSESVVLISVNLGILLCFGVEDFLSEHVFFLGSEGEAVFSYVLKEFSADISFVLAEILESKGEGGFAE